MKPRVVVLWIGVSLLGIFGAVHAASAQDPPQPQPDNTATAAPGPTVGGLNANMKLEDLVKQDVIVPGLSTPVTTVERSPSTIGKTPAAVFVITPEMIKRSGARNLPDVLRMAPGVQVAWIDAHTWAISIRGFNGRFDNKLLVQIDGRIVYNPTFGGVFWDLQNLVLEDIERIEVIRGPQTTMWGSNAVNGVINILTKKSSDTQAALVQSGGGGQQNNDFNIVRYGGNNGAGLTWRAYGQQFDNAAGWSTTNVPDAWEVQQGGFRMDYAPNREETYTLQGDMQNGYGGDQTTLPLPTFPFRQTINERDHFPAGNVVFRYSRVLDDETSWQFLTYYDRYQYNTVKNWQTVDTGYVDLQYQFMPWDGHQFISGVNYRASHDFTTGGYAFTYDPPGFTTQWASVFIQDTMALEEDRWYFTLGTRFEQNTFGGFQVEPTARLLFLPTERQSAWVAVSRAARNPNRLDEALNVKIAPFPPGVPVQLNLTGNPNIDPESLIAYEIGYRAAPTDTFTWDIAGYINDYDKVVGQQPNGPPFAVPPIVFIPIQYANNMRALSYGFETTATWQVNDRWRWFASYSLFEVDAEGPDARSVGLVEGSSPHNQVYLRSSWDLWRNVQFDLAGRYVDALTFLDVPYYFEMDARISWQITKNMDVSFVGQNLLNSHHLEFIDAASGLAPTETRRNWYGMLTWRF